MTSARSVFLYLCVGLAAVAALALSAAAVTSSGSPSRCAGISFASNPEFLNGHSFKFASQTVANAANQVFAPARAERPVRVAPASRAANAGHKFQNTQENAGSGTVHVGFSWRDEKRGTGSL